MEKSKKGITASQIAEKTIENFTKNGEVYAEGILPCGGMNSARIRVEFKNRQVTVYCKDPYGANRFYAEYRRKIYSVEYGKEGYMDLAFGLGPYKEVFLELAVRLTPTGELNPVNMASFMGLSL